MKRGLVFLFATVLVLSLFLTVSVSAQQASEKRMSFKEIEDKAGTVPGDAFYFMDRAFDVFQSSEKLADERAYELAVLANKSAEGEEVSNKTMEKARERYEKTIRKVKRKAERREDVAERVANSTTKHMEVLSMVHEKVPEEAKGAIEKAMNNSAKGRENALNALNQFNQTKAEEMRNQTSQRIQNRVSEEVRNRVQEMAEVSFGPGPGAGQEAGTNNDKNDSGQGTGNDSMQGGQEDMNNTPSGTQNVSPNNTPVM